MRDLWRWITGERPAFPDPDALARSDPWVALPLAPPLAAYGPGAHLAFPEYLKGPTRIACTSPEEIAEWLLECHYADDDTLLGEHDQWLHPSTFEIVRCGDCEDFSLWGWRKLLEAGLESWFAVGTRRRPDGRSGRHAWAVFRRGDELWILDGVERTTDRMLRTVASARSEYEPQVGVSPTGGRFVYAGFYRSQWGRRMLHTLEATTELP